MPTRRFSFGRLLAGCSLASLLLCAGAPHAAAQEIDWRTDYGKARKEAMQKGLPLVIDFSTENCFWCKQLELRTFSDAGVIDMLNGHCVPLHIDAGRNPELIDKMNIQSFPTLVYASPEGRVLGYQEGFIEAPVFRDQVQRTVNAVSAPDWMTRDYEEAAKAAGQGDYARALALLKGVVEDGKERLIQAKARQLLADVEQRAAERLTSAKQQADRGETAEALKSAGEVMHQFAGADAAREAADFAATLTGRTDAGEQQRRDRARDLLAQAREDFRTQQYLCCLDRCEALASQFADLPEGGRGGPAVGRHQGQRRMGEDGRRPDERPARRAVPVAGRHLPEEGPAAAGDVLPAARGAELPQHAPRRGGAGAAVADPGAADADGGFQEVAGVRRAAGV